MISPVKIWRNQKSIQNLIGKRGKIVAWTIIRVPQAGFAHLSPYPVVIVSIEGGEKGTFQLVDYNQSDLRVGAEVELVIRRIFEPASDGVIPYGVKAKLV